MIPISLINNCVPSELALRFCTYLYIKLGDIWCAEVFFSAVDIWCGKMQQPA